MFFDDQFKNDNVGSSSAQSYVDSVEKTDERDGFSKVFSDYKRQSAGVISEAKKKEVYLKPSVRRKLKSELARKKRNKRNKNNNYRFGNK